MKQIGSRLAWLVSEATRPCWLAITFGLLAAALLVHEGMDVDQDHSMDVDDPPLNSSDEGEQRLPFPGEIVNGKRQVRYMRM